MVLTNTNFLEKAGKDGGAEEARRGGGDVAVAVARGSEQWGLQIVLAPWSPSYLFCSVLYPTHSIEHRTHEATQANRDNSQSTTSTLHVSVL